MLPLPKTWRKEYDPLLFGAETTCLRHWRGSGADANSPTGNLLANENILAEENLSAKESPVAKENPHQFQHLHSFHNVCQLPQILLQRGTSNTEERLESKLGPFLAHFPMLAPRNGICLSGLPCNNSYSGAFCADVVRSREPPSDHSGPSDSQHNEHGESA